MAILPFYTSSVHERLSAVVTDGSAFLQISASHRLANHVYRHIFFKIRPIMKVVLWRKGYSVGVTIHMSWVQILLGAMMRINRGQVVHTHVPLSPSSITWYRPKGGDALRLGR